MTAPSGGTALIEGGTRTWFEQFYSSFQVSIYILSSPTYIAPRCYFFWGDKILCLVTSCSNLFLSKKISWNLLPVIVNQIPPCLAKKSPHNRWSLIQFGGKRFFYREPMRHLLHSTNCCHLNVNTWLLKVIVQHKVCLSFFLSFTDLPLAPLFKFNLPLNLDIAMFHWSWKSQLTQTFNLMQILYQSQDLVLEEVFL